MFLCTGGLSHPLFISLLISKLFCTKSCMGGRGERDIVNSLRPAREGERWWGDKVTFLGPNGTCFAHSHFRAQKESRFSGPTPSHGPRNWFSRIKIITSRALETTGTLIVNISTSVQGRTFLSFSLLLSFSLSLSLFQSMDWAAGQSDSNKIHQSRNQDFNCGCQIPLSTILKPNSWTYNFIERHDIESSQTWISICLL